jgi:tetratricopeptide (TPR) repeat protein
MAFSAAAVAAGLAQETERVDDGCTALARREQFLRASGEQTWPDGTVAGGYRFVHALYQQVLYNRVSAARRIRLHQRIGTRLEAGHGTEAGAMAAELAMHFERGRNYPRAVQYLQLAGQQAVQRAAYVEAIRHVTTALELLKTLPDTVERAQLELGLLTALAPALQITRGEAASELEPVLTRAEALAQQVGEPSQRFAVLRSLWMFRHVRTEYRAAQAAAEQLLDLAQHQHDPALLLGVHHALGQTLYQLGAFAQARTHFEQGIALDDPQRHATTHTTPGEMRNYGVRCRGLVTRVLWDLGYPNQAVQRAQEALTMAHALAHPFSLSVTLHESVLLHGCLREWRTVQSHAETVLALAIEHGFTRYVAMATYQRGRALAAQGLGAEGIAQMRQALAAVRATRTALGMPNFLAWLAEAYGRVGQVDEGLPLLGEALAMVGTTGERRNEAELHRLHGELLLRQAVPEVQVAEACFQQALTIAHRQQAKSWELRAAMSLSRLWQCQGKRTAAYELLAPIYSWFIEGFDTVDLQEAKMLLEELA